MFGWRRKRRKRKQDRGVLRDAAEGGAEAATEATAEGCLGCDIPLVIGLTVLAGVSLLLF